jgi:hypothetical protein
MVRGCANVAKLSRVDVGNSIRKAIDDWQQGELDAAMLHACNAVDGTAAKSYPRLGSRRRFTRLLRENYLVLGPMGAPGINLDETRFPVKVKRRTAEGDQPDFADVLYGVHRCCHGHGEALPGGFDLIHDASGPPRRTRMEVKDGSVRFSDRVIFGLLAVAVLAPVNSDQRVPDGYFLTFGSDNSSLSTTGGAESGTFLQLLRRIRHLSSHWTSLPGRRPADCPRCACRLFSFSSSVGDRHRSRTTSSRTNARRADQLAGRKSPP